MDNPIYDAETPLEKLAAIQGGLIALMTVFGPYLTPAAMDMVSQLYTYSMQLTPIVHKAQEQGL